MTETRTIKHPRVALAFELCALLAIASGIYLLGSIRPHESIVNRWRLHQLNATVQRHNRDRAYLEQLCTDERLTPQCLHVEWGTGYPQSSRYQPFTPYQP